MSPLLLSYLVLLLWLSCCLVDSHEHNKQYIISFNVKLKQQDQKQYLSKHFPADAYVYIFRRYVSLHIPSDFAVIQTSQSLDKWLTTSPSYQNECDQNRSLIKSFHEDSLGQSRQLLSDNDEAEDVKTGSDYFDPAHLSSSFSAAGIRGQGVKVAIFDTGLSRGHPSFFHKPYERTDWTSEGELGDFIGHGTFVASVVTGTDNQCPGMAPDVDLHVFRIFNKAQKAYTSWFLDAFNYAMYLGIDVINLSIGGPDFGDLPFVDKIDELAASGVIVVSAVGNEGPLWGTLHNPADQNSVIGVGGWRSRREEGEEGWTHNAEVGEVGGGEVASFSSRGMTLWNTRPRVKTHVTRPLFAPGSGGKRGRGDADADADNDNGFAAENPLGMGRVKPDLLAPSYRLRSSSHLAPYACRTLSGTSVANPIVVASIALLLSSLSSPRHTARRSAVANVAAMKQILLSTANPVKGYSLFEQGSGVLNLTAAYSSLLAHTPHVSAIPSHISNFNEDCPRLWPWCGQALFSSSQPLLAALTLLNSIASTGHIARIQFFESSTLGIFSDDVSFRMSEDDPLHPQDAESTFAVSLRTPLLTVRIQAVRTVWPWVGTVEVQVSVNSGPPAAAVASFQGDVNCTLLITLHTTTSTTTTIPNEESPPDAQRKRQTATVTFRLHITPPPPREKRILWDVFHSIAFPSAFVPNDNPSDQRTKLDLLGDHPFTNYRDAYLMLQRLGYTVEILRKPWTCFDASLFAVLVLCDLEEELSPEEINKLEEDVRVRGLSVLVIADWFDENGLLEGSLLDDNTHSRWFPITGGSNVPAVNRFLGRFGMQFGVQAFKGSIRYENSIIELQTGNTLAAWPAGGHLWRAETGQLFPLFGGHLRAQFGTQQAFAGFYQVESGSGTAAEEGHGEGEDAALQYREGVEVEGGADEESLLRPVAMEAAAILKRGNQSQYLQHARGAERQGGAGRAGRLVAIGDSAFVDSSSFEHNSIYGSFKLLEVLVGFLAGETEGETDGEREGGTSAPAAPFPVSGGVRGKGRGGAWSSLPELLTEDYRDARLTAAFSSFSAVSVDKLQRERELRQREFQRYSRLLLRYFDHEDHDFPDHTRDDGEQANKNKIKLKNKNKQDYLAGEDLLVGKFLPVEEFCSAF